MIFEYALEPEMVAAWGARFNHRFFIREFGLGQGRMVSRYPKSWAKKVWESFDGASQMDRKRLEELLARLKETMVKRKDFIWEEGETWLDNALAENARHPFQAVLAMNNPTNRPEILIENALAVTPCPGWDHPHGMTVSRKIPDMVEAVHSMLACCRWVKFVDPYFVKGKIGHKKSWLAFMQIFGTERPAGPPELIEIHTSGDGATTAYLEDFYEKITPLGLQVTLYRWQERLGGQKLHNRYILTNLGGVSFQHGLDTGAEGETDDISRLDREQCNLRCKQYDSTTQVFDQARPPLVIIGKC